MTGSNYLGTFKQTGERIRLDLAARRRLRQRVQMNRILYRQPRESPAWLTPYPQRSDPK